MKKKENIKIILKIYAKIFNFLTKYKKICSRIIK